MSLRSRSPSRSTARRPAPAEASSGNRRLTGPEAESLWRAWKKHGDIRALATGSCSPTRPMVKYLASRKARELPAHCELDDLISCGLVAVLEAVDRFDPAKGATFEQYAWTRVAGSIVDELRRQDRVSRSSRCLARSIERTQDNWLSATAVMPNESELADELKIEVAELRERTGELDRAHVVSLNAPAGDEQGRRARRDDRRRPGPAIPTARCSPARRPRSSGRRSQRSPSVSATCSPSTSRACRAPRSAACSASPSRASLRSSRPPARSSAPS